MGSNWSVVHGTMEIANQMSTLCWGLRKVGRQAISVNYYPSYLGYRNDVEYDILAAGPEAGIRASREVARVTIPSTTHFHFHFGQTLALDFSDLDVIRDRQMPIVMHHWGSDVRRASIARQFSPDVAPKEASEASICRRLEFLASRIPAAIVADAELAMYVRDYYEKTYLLPQAIVLEDYPRAVPPFVNGERDRPVRIAHAPTSRGYKGSSYVLAAFEALQEQCDIEVLLVEGVGHAQAKEIYRSADIIVDQLLSGQYGLLAIEGMAMGKPVVSFINDMMRDFYPDSLPIVVADRHSIEGVLLRLIQDRDALGELGAAGREYVKLYHDVSRMIPRLEEIYSGVAVPGVSWASRQGESLWSS